MEATTKNANTEYNSIKHLWNNNFLLVAHHVQKWPPRRWCKTHFMLDRTESGYVSSCLKLLCLFSVSFEDCQKQHIKCYMWHFYKWKCLLVLWFNVTNSFDDNKSANENFFNHILDRYSKVFDRDCLSHIWRTYLRYSFKLFAYN